MEIAPEGNGETITLRPVLSELRSKAIEPTFSRGHRGEVSGRLAPRRTTGTITL
jgi:hypothetical protein